MNTELLTPAESPQVETMKRADLPAIWDGYRGQLEKLKATAETLTVTSVSQKAEMKLARVTRLTLKDLRVEIEHRRKELGEDALRQKQSIDSSAKELREIIEGLETRLLEQEQFAERKAAEEKAARLAHRTELLKPFATDLAMFSLNDMEDGAFAELLEQVELAHTAKIEAAAKAEADRIAKEKADAEERERIRLENERLKKEAAAREEEARKAREAAEADRKKHELELERQRKEAADKAAKAKAKADAEAKATADKARKEREAIESKARAEREAAEAKAKKEREAREKAEAELKAKRDAEEKARKDAEAAAKKAARAPDREKLIAFRQQLIALEIPTMATTEGSDARAELIYRISELQEWIETTAATL